MTDRTLSGSFTNPGWVVEFAKFLKERIFEIYKGFSRKNIRYTKRELNQNLKRWFWFVWFPIWSSLWIEIIIFWFGCDNSLIVKNNKSSKNIQIAGNIDEIRSKLTEIRRKLSAQSATRVITSFNCHHVLYPITEIISTTFVYVRFEKKYAAIIKDVL